MTAVVSTWLGWFDSRNIFISHFRLEVLWEEEKKANSKTPSLFKVIYRLNFGITYKSVNELFFRFISTRLWFSCAVFFFCLIFGFIGPTCFIRRLIAFAENPERDESEQIVYSYGIALVAAISFVEFARVLSYGATWAVSYRLVCEGYKK